MENLKGQTLIGTTHSGGFIGNMGAGFVGHTHTGGGFFGQIPIGG